MWNRTMKFFERVGRAKAAAEFARMGRQDLAKKIMLNEGAV